jgi:hypothetical protein
MIGEMAVPRGKFQDAACTTEIAAAKEDVDRVVVGEPDDMIDVCQGHVSRRYDRVCCMVWLR